MKRVMRLNMLVATALLVPVVVAAGCINTANSPVQGASLAGAGAAAAPQAFELAFNGSTPVFAEGCAWTPLAGQCAGTPTPGADFSKVRFEPKLNGTPKAIHAVITWTAVSPATQQMTIFAGAYKGGSYKGYGGHMGASPLKFDVDSVDAPAGYQIYIGLVGPAMGDSAGGAGGSFDANAQDQPWKLSGNVTLT